MFSTNFFDTFIISPFPMVTNKPEWPRPLSCVSWDPSIKKHGLPPSSIEIIKGIQHVWQIHTNRWRRFSQSCTFGPFTRVQWNSEASCMSGRDLCPNHKKLALVSWHCSFRSWFNSAKFRSILNKKYGAEFFLCLPFNLSGKSLLNFLITKSY